jgi:hypothetical protein
MIDLHPRHVVGIKDGMRRAILVPGNGEDYSPKEIHLIKSEDRIVAYVLVTRVEIGAIRHWCHDRSTMSAYGCAVPHDLSAKIRTFYPDHKFKEGEGEPWTKISFTVVDGWEDENAEKMGQALWALKFKTGVGKKL